MVQIKNLAIDARGLTQEQESVLPTIGVRLMWGGLCGHYAQLLPQGAAAYYESCIFVGGMQQPNL